MSEIPGYQKIDAVRNGDGDVRRIISSLAGNSSRIEQDPRKPIRIRSRVKKRNSFQCLQPGAGCLRVTRPSFRNNKR